MNILIVDKDDNVIGAKERPDLTYDKDIYRIAALWLTNSKGKVLLAQRKLTKDKDPGLWGPAAAGTVEEGETYESNIYKEAEEEIGLTGINFVLGPKLFIEKPSMFYAQWFIGKCDWPVEKFKVQETEVEKVEWIDADKLKQDILRHPENYVSQMSLIAERLL